MTTVLVTDYTWESLDREAAIFAEIGAEIVAAPDSDEATLVRLAPESDAILTCFAHVTEAVVRAAPKLRVIGRYGIGVDNIDVAAATARGIPVTNVPGYCTDEVAEHTLAMILAQARQLTAYDRDVRAGGWSLGAAPQMHRLAGSTLGLFGFGAIAQEVARRASSFGLRVIAHARSATAEQTSALGVEKVTLEELIARSDFLSLHVPLTPETEGIVNAQFLEGMKPGSVLVNTARGGLVDQEALVAALRAGSIGAAALDVFTPERLPAGHPLLHHPRVLATPHVAFSSEESLAELAERAAQNVATVLSGGRAADTVNPEIYDAVIPGTEGERS